MTRGWLLAGLAIAIATIVTVNVSHFKTPELDTIHAGIEATYPRVEHIAAEDFVAQSPAQLVVFDVRRPEEYNVSHLPGAILVDPDTNKDEFADRFGPMLEGKRAVFYCSVGVRSSIMAERVADLVEERTQSAPLNLIGGLFQWSNDGRIMTTPAGTNTRAIHPYDNFWGRLIDNQDMISRPGGS